MGHYPSSGCRGYGCKQQAAAGASSRGPYGPYHSYAVRPAVYGGHGLYTYRGYARHPPAYRNRPRHPRSHAPAPRRRPAGCRGRYCPAPPRHYAAPPPPAARRPQYGYMRPVKAVALVPANNYPARPMQHNGYRPLPAAASYGGGRGATHGSGHYRPANSNNNAHQQRYRQGAQKASNNGY
jgi:hypothetical protein